MNPDGTENHQPDLTSPNHSAEIIDVRVVEEISSVPKPLGDVWASDTVAETHPQPPISATASTQMQPNLPEPTGDTPLPLDDNWSILLDEISQELEPEPEIETVAKILSVSASDATVSPLARAEAEIKVEIAKLQATQSQLEQQIVDTQISFGQIIQTSVTDLEQRRQKLQISVEQLERRRDRIKEEISKSFAGGSQDIAIRLQGFKDYLVGSLQDLVVIAEEIEFPEPPPAQIRIQTPLDRPSVAPQSEKSKTPQFTEPAFRATASKVRASLDRYRTAPDYYAPAWQLRRTLEPVHSAERTTFVY